MKLGLFTILFLFLIVPLAGLAQNDTLIINNNYKFKIGVKGTWERSANLVLDAPIYNYGLQGIFKLGSTKSSIETGIYYYTKNVLGFYIDTTYSSYPREYNVPISYRNIHIPVKYRLDTKIIYFTVGFYGDYLLKIDTDARIQKAVNQANNDNFYLGYTASIGFEKAIAAQFSLFFELSYTSENLNHGEGVFLPSNTSVAFGVNYKFLKH